MEGAESEFLAVLVIIEEVAVVVQQQQLKNKNASSEWAPDKSIKFSQIGRIFGHILRGDWIICE